MILALITERVSGRSFQDLIDEQVCKPAGMTNTAFLRSDALPGRAALGLGFWLGPDNAVSIHGFDAGVGFVSVHDPSRHLTLSVMSNKSRGAWPCSQRIMQIVTGRFFYVCQAAI